MLPPNFGSRSGDTGLALGGAAFAVGGAADGYAQSRRQRPDSMDSFEVGRPMSTLMEENEDYGELPPPMTQIPAMPPVAAAGYAPDFMSSSGRLRNYGASQAGSQAGRHSAYDGMQDHPRDVSASETDYGAYDVNQYDGDSSYGYHQYAPSSRR